RVGTVAGEQSEQSEQGRAQTTGRRGGVRHGFYKRLNRSADPWTPQHREKGHGRSSPSTLGARCGPLHESSNALRNVSPSIRGSLVSATWVRGTVCSSMTERTARAIELLSSRASSARPDATSC